jgi:predicted alpha/beta-hydrolase family hydrolase
MKISNIPATLWGEKSNKLFIAVHGNLSHKEDTVIELLADEATRKGYQVLSFDLPEHGDRKTEGTPCKVQHCVQIS